MKYPAWAVQVVLRVEAALRDVQQHLRIEHEFYCNGIVVTNYNQNDKRDDNCSWLVRMQVCCTHVDGLKRHHFSILSKQQF
jgi:hypothetical protein